MSVMFRTIGFPSDLMTVESATFMLSPIQITSGMPLSGFVRASGLVSMLWNGQFNFSLMEQEKWQEFESFIARLAGQAVLFEISAPHRVLPLGAAAGFAEGNPTYPVTGVNLSGVNIRTGANTCMVKEYAPRYAQSLLLKGLKPSSLVLTPGDTFGVGGNVYLCTGKVASDANGEARVPFRWRLHKPAREGDIIAFRKPRLRVQLKSPTEGLNNVEAAMQGRAAFAFVEVPYAA